MRIVWNDYVVTQMAWFSSLSKLANDPSIAEREYLSAKAKAAFVNARSVSDVPPQHCYSGFISNGAN